MVHRLFLVTMLEFAPESVLQMCFGSSFVFNAKQIMSNRAGSEKIDAFEGAAVVGQLGSS